MSFPKESELKPKNMLDIRDPVSRVSLDTFYQVSFSFGNYDKWFNQTASGSRRTNGADFMQKMNLLCTQAEIPGTSFLTTQAVGHYQGVQEVFPTLRQFPPLNLTFYIDADHLVLQVLENWMTYINPLSNKKRLNAYGRLNYPGNYKEIIHLSKFERDTFLEGKTFSGSPRATTTVSSYEFINVWPTNLESMRISYGQSSILRCSVQLAYDRFFTSFDQTNQVQTPVADGGMINLSKDIINDGIFSNNVENNKTYIGTKGITDTGFSSLTGLEHMPQN